MHNRHVCSSCDEYIYKKDDLGYTCPGCGHSITDAEHQSLTAQALQETEALLKSVSAAANPVSPDLKTFGQKK